MALPAQAPFQLVEMALKRHSVLVRLAVGLLRHKKIGLAVVVVSLGVAFSATSSLASPAGSKGEESAYVFFI